MHIVCSEISAKTRFVGKPRFQPRAEKEESWTKLSIQLKNFIKRKKKTKNPPPRDFSFQEMKRSKIQEEKKNRFINNYQKILLQEKL